MNEMLSVESEAGVELTLIWLRCFRVGPRPKVGHGKYTII